MRIRSITVFAQVALPLDAARIMGLGKAGRAAAEAYSAAGYEVQTLRLATDLFPHLASLGSEQRAIDAVADFEACCTAAGFQFVALGPADTETQPLVPQILRTTEAVFTTSHIVRPDGFTIDVESLRGAAQVIHDASRIEQGFGNLRFAALANVPPGTPFFPAAYWRQETPAIAVATESADLALTACRSARNAAEAHGSLQAQITTHGKHIELLGQEVGREQHMPFLGVDFSLAPYPDAAISIGGALEALTGRPLGSAGTLAAAATLTDAIQQADFLHTGFCGLMMPVLEDNVLALRAAEGRLHISDLLQWSAVCGTGLDTVPLPGNASVESLASLLFDVAALSVRLGKPLTARLMPLPGKEAGDPVHFDFPYFADGGVLPLEYAEGTGSLLRTRQLKLSKYSR